MLLELAPCQLQFGVSSMYACMHADHFRAPLTMQFFTSEGGKHVAVAMEFFHF